MRKRKLKRLKMQLLETVLDLDKLESLSRILTDCIREPISIKEWDAENLSRVMSEKINGTKQKFDDIDRIFKV